MSCDPTSNGFQTLNDYVLGPGGEQVTEMSVDANNSLAWQHTNVYAAGSLIGTYDTTGLHFYFNDPLGTRRAQTDYAGVLEQTCASLPFGDGLTCTGSTTAPTEHHFTGKERDTESGNDYFPARYYASSMGRFMSPDPYNGSYDTSNPQSMNRYVYAMNNPLSYVDPSGKAPCTYTDEDGLTCPEWEYDASYSGPPPSPSDFQKSLSGVINCDENPELAECKAAANDPANDPANAQYYGNPFKKRPFNGSFWDKPFKEQDNQCSAPGAAGPWMDNNGMLSACQWHDNQYTKFQCNFSSFLPLIPGPCTVANIVLVVWLSGDGLKLLF
jgi:RHS repeat-associated protein